MIDTAHTTPPMNQLALELFAPNPIETAIRAALDNHDQSCPPNVFKTATKAYSADKIGQSQPIRTFQWRGFLYTTTGTAGAACPGGTYAHAWKVVAKADYPGEPFKYPGNQGALLLRGDAREMQGKGVRPYRPRTRIEAMSFFAVDPIEDPSAPVSRKSNAYD